MTEDAIREAVASGVHDFAELQVCTGCSTGCGCCEAEARRIFQDALEGKPLALSVAVAA